MKKMAITAPLAEWVANWPVESASPIVRSRAREALEDTIGCMIAGAGDIAAERARATIGAWRGTGATVAGMEQEAAPPFAAFANATATHALDFDDTAGHALTHASAVLFSALLALGEHCRLSCRDVLFAWIVGVEVQVALGRAVNRAHYDGGWHATSTLGLIGAAAACSRLLELDVAQTKAALSLSTSMMAGSKGQFGTMAKPIHAGLAAKGAVLAATMAKEGITASSEPLEGKYGFLALYCGGKSRRFEPILAELGSPPAVEWLGLDTKRYPCCSSMHLALDAFSDLQSAHRFAPDEIAQATATIDHGPSLALITQPPSSEIEARFSLPYAAAALLSTGTLSLSDFTERSFARPEIQALSQRITMATWPEGIWPADRPAPSEVRVVLHSGRTMTARAQEVRGSIARPMTAADRASKFEDCAGGILPDAQYAELREALAAADGSAEVKQLMALLRFSATVDRGERFLDRAPGGTVRSAQAMASAR